MGIIFLKPKKLSLTNQIIKESDCMVSVIENGRQLESVYIEFSGKCAEIPSIKNQRRGHWLEYSAQSKLKAMDALYTKELMKLKKLALSFGDIPVSVLVICGERKRQFDALNCADTIADWLEPSEKQGRGKSRGWGIGLIDNDNQAHISAYHAEWINWNTTATTIIVRSWESVRQQSIEYITEFFLPKHAHRVIKA